jgi:glycosyltransferase involved in cell wall biosynthesis
VYNSFTRWERLLIDDDRVRIIPNGVDLNRIDRTSNSDYSLRNQFGIPPGAVVVGTVGKITKQKAHDVLVHAANQADNRSDSPRVDLVIVGDGPLRSDVESLSSDLGISNQVHITGLVRRQRVYEILSKIDVYAMPSRWEGFSNAAVEALGAGKPCVFSDIEPFSLPYRDVALFHRVDDATNLGTRLIDFIMNTELRDQYGRRGRKLIEENYTLEAIAHQYAQLYAELV